MTGTGFWRVTHRNTEGVEWTDVYKDVKGGQVEIVAASRGVVPYSGACPTLWTTDLAPCRTYLWCIPNWYCVPVQIKPVSLAWLHTHVPELLTVP